VALPWKAGYVLAAAHELGAAKDLGGGRFSLDSSCLPAIMDMMQGGGSSHRRVPDIKALCQKARLDPRNRI
jgi:hypothetical protein